MSKSCGAVIFDLGRVLIDYDWSVSLKRLCRWTALAPEEAERRILGQESIARFETGQLSEADFHAHVEESIGAHLPFGEFEAVWNSIFTGEIVPVARVARAAAVSGGLRFAVLSNTNETHVRFLRRTWPLLNELPNVFLSNEIRRRKPDPLAYRHVLERIGAGPEETLFVDDLPHNIAAARTLGLQTIHVTSPEQAVEALAEYGLTADGKAPSA